METTTGAQPFSVRLPPDLRALLDERARELRRKPTDLARLLIWQGLHRDDPPGAFETVVPRPRATPPATDRAEPPDRLATARTALEAAVKKGLLEKAHEASPNAFYDQMETYGRLEQARTALEAAEARTGVRPSIVASFDPDSEVEPT